MGGEKEAWFPAKEFGSNLPGEVQSVSFKDVAPHWSNMLKWMETYTKGGRKHQLD